METPKGVVSRPENGEVGDEPACRFNSLQFPQSPTARKSESAHASAVIPLVHGYLG